MPVRPFPLPLSIGTDLCHVVRILDILKRARQRPNQLQLFLRRFLSHREQVAFNTRFQNRENKDVFDDLASKHLAGRWAAKEAAIKAVTWRKLSFMDVHVASKGVDGGVYAVILDRPASPSEPPEIDSTTTGSSADADELSGQVARLSISHEGEYASAVCLVVEQGTPPGNATETSPE